MADPKTTVRIGYDLVSRTYRPDVQDQQGDEYLKYKSWIDALSTLIAPKSSVLDLGCGCGVPVAGMLALYHMVTGIDISPKQIERARKLVPMARFSCSDMCDAQFPSGSFAVVICLYALIHIPVEDQPALISNIYQWLKPGGCFLCTVGQSTWTGIEHDWLGVAGADMYWSHASRETYLDWFSSTGFEIEWERFVPEGEFGHPVLLARKPVE